jgi:ATP-dependent DNA helicase RecG
MPKKNPIDQLAIYSALDWGEDYQIEYKSAKGGLPKSLWETYSAFANSNGGIILLGVEKDGTVSGLETSSLPKLKKSFWDTVHDRGKVSINLMTEDDVKEIPYKSDVILAIRVPRASRYQRPVYLDQNPTAGTYRRNYEGDYHCSEQEVRLMFSDCSEESADYKIVENFTLDDLDRRSLQEYRRVFASHKPTHPWLSEDDIGFLTKLGGWRKNKKDGSEGITMAAILMFGTDESIREATPQYQIDYRETDPQSRWKDRINIDGTWVANLFQFYLRVMQRLVLDLKLPFQLDENLFRKGETVVHEAIREALVNAIIHADYFGKGGVVIEKKCDRFEFSNPGSLLIPISHLLDQKLRNGISECRNKILQQMFLMIGAAEKAGSGIDKIYRGWESQHWRKPATLEESQLGRVRWILPTISLIPDESLLRLKEYFGSKFEKLSQLEVQALVTADIEGSVDNARMRQITDNHATDITKLLQSLVAREMLFQESKNRWARYRLNSLHKKNHSLHKENHSLHKENHSLHKELSQEELAELKIIAAPASNSKRLDPKLMEDLIKKLCENRWLTRRQISDLLDRNTENVRTRFLVPMIEHKILRLLYPEKPNRVDQAYSTSSTANPQKNLHSLLHDL